MIEVYINISIISLGFLSSFYLFFKYPKIDKRLSRKTTQKLSIIIPARNEEKTIGLLLSDLKSQLTPHIEVIVVDDDSSDQTANIISKFNVKKVTIKKADKPKEYLGKSWALEYGSSFAKHDLLLFLDSDVRLEKNAINILLNYYEIHKTTLTVQPYHITNKFHEQFSMPFNLISLAANNVSTINPKPIGLFGPVILIEKSVYKNIGKHSLVKSSIIEDVSLGMTLRKNNYDFMAYIGQNIINYRMYPDGYISLYEGWTKNIAYGAQKSSLLLKILIFFVVASLLSVPLNLVLFIFSKNLIILTTSIIFYIIWSIRLFYLTKPLGKYKLYTIIFFPIFIYHFLFIFIVSLIKKIFKIPVKWKGRSITERKSK